MALVTSEAARKGRESTPEIRAAYRHRVAWRNAIIIGWALYGMAILWTGWIPDRLLPWFLFGGVAAFGGTSLAIWRCPACGASLGRLWREASCPTCGMAFVDDRDRQPNER